MGEPALFDTMPRFSAAWCMTRLKVGVTASSSVAKAASRLQLDAGLARCWRADRGSMLGYSSMLATRPRATQLETRGYWRRVPTEA